MAKRIYKDVGNGYAVQTSQVYDGSNGQTYYAAIDSMQPVSISDLKGRGYTVIMGDYGRGTGSGFAIQNVEGANGTQDNSRLEQMDLEGLASGVGINISIDNTSKTAAQMQVITGNSAAVAYNAISQKVPLFDGAGLISRFLGYSSVAPLAVGVTFDGDFGRDSLLQYRETTKSIPIDLHNLQLTINNPDLYKNLGIEASEAQINGASPMSKRIDIISLGRATDFNTAIRQLEKFRFQANALTSLVVTIPAGATLNLNFQGKAVGKAFSMVKL